jgi:hypothetical protein
MRSLSRDLKSKPEWELPSSKDLRFHPTLVFDRHAGSADGQIPYRSASTAPSLLKDEVIDEQPKAVSF